jgi:hypothetical protein
MTAGSYSSHPRRLVGSVSRSDTSRDARFLRSSGGLSTPGPLLEVEPWVAVGDRSGHSQREDAAAQAPEGEADLERALETWVSNCTKSGLDVHWVGGLGVSPGHWAHREPSPQGEPASPTGFWR